MKSTATPVLSAILLVLTAMPATASTLVFLLGGQSNMAGTGGYPGGGYGPADAPCPAPYNVAQPAVKFWNYGCPATNGDGINDPKTGDGWTDLQPGFGHTPAEFGPEVSFGYRLHQLFPNDEIYLVKYGFTSTNLAVNWNPNNPPSWKRCYQSFRGRVDAAMHNLRLANKAPVIAGMVWMQGESDAMNHDYAAAYQANLTNLITRARNDFAAPNMKFVLGRITNYAEWGTPADNALVRNAQMIVPTQMANVVCVNTDDLQWAYNGHYGTQGQIALGTRFANQFATPEPATSVLVGTGILALAGYVWGRKD